MLKYSIFLLLSLFFSACSSEYPVVNRIVKVPLPQLSDSLNVVYKTDTLILATHTHMRDTLVRIEYLPGIDKFFYRIRQDTLIVPSYDTIYLAKYFQTQSTDYKWYFVAFVVITLLFLFIFKLYPS